MDLRPVQFAIKAAQENRDKNQKTGKNRDNWRFGWFCRLDCDLPFLFENKKERKDVDPNK
jgi:hypothetical protein